MRVAATALALCAVACSKGKSDDKAAANQPPTTAPEPAKPPPADAPPAAKYTTPEAKLARYLDCWKAFDSGKDDVFAGCFAPDAVREQIDSVPPQVAQGSEKIVDMAKAQRAAFPDLVVTPQLVIVSGNDIAAILHVSGTNTGEVPEMRTTKKKLGLFEAEIVTMNADGTFARDSIYVDQPTIYHQLGLLENDTSPKPLDKHTAEPVTLISKNDATEAANKSLIERNLDAVNKKNAKLILASVADTIQLTYHGDKQRVAGKRAYSKWLDDLLHSTKDGFVDIKNLWTASDYVIVADVFTGTPTQAAVGKDVEPKRIETHVVQFFRVKDGKLEEQQIFANSLKSAVQLGIVDPDQLMQTLAKNQ